MIVYNERDELCNDILCRITREEAISAQKMAGEAKGYTYANDKMALEDFMTIHWAWKED